MIEDDGQLAATRQNIAELQALLLGMKRRVPCGQYRQMAQAFLADIQRMEEEIHEYLLTPAIGRFYRKK